MTLIATWRRGRTDGTWNSGCGAMRCDAVRCGAMRCGAVRWGSCTSTRRASGAAEEPRRTSIHPIQRAACGQAMTWQLASAPTTIDRRVIDRAECIETPSPKEVGCYLGKGQRSSSAAAGSSISSQTSSSSSLSSSLHLIQVPYTVKLLLPPPPPPVSPTVFMFSDLCYSASGSLFATILGSFAVEALVFAVVVLGVEARTGV
jgi:hypothetical protein